jgi:hypothetical protein
MFINNNGRLTIKKRYWRNFCPIGLSTHTKGSILIKINNKLLDTMMEKSKRRPYIKDSRILLILASEKVL